MPLVSFRQSCEMLHDINVLRYNAMLCRNHSATIDEGENALKRNAYNERRDIELRNQAFVSFISSHPRLPRLPSAPSAL